MNNVDYYAFLDQSNTVIEVIAGVQQAGSTTNWETYYSEVRGIPCKRTTLDGSFRKNYAGIGYKYSAALDAFIPPKPGPDEYYTLDQQTCRWKLTPAGSVAVTSDAIKAHFDTIARQREYDSLLTIDTYKGSNVPKWAAEHAAFFAWRDQCWLVAYQIQADVAAGLRPVPTPEQVISELPVLVWPS
jgi:hypothetical protein